MNRRTYLYHIWIGQTRKLEVRLHADTDALAIAAYMWSWGAPKDDRVIIGEGEPTEETRRIVYQGQLSEVEQAMGWV